MTTADPPGAGMTRVCIRERVEQCVVDAPREPTLCDIVG